MAASKFHLLMMPLNEKIILAIILISLLIQNSLCNPLPSPKSEVQEIALNKILNHLKNGSDENELTPKEKLFLFTLQEFEKLTHNFEERSSRVIESTLKDEEMANGANENVVAFKKQLHKYLDSVQNNTKIFPQCLSIMEEFSKVVSKYDLDEMNATTATEEQKYFARILDKNGLGQLNRDFAEIFLNALNRIYDETKKYMNDLNEEDVKRIEKFTKIMDTLKTKNTNDDKLKYIFDLIDKDESNEEKEENAKEE